MKWKYQKKKPKFDYDEYFKSKQDVPVKVKVKYPEVIKKLVDGEYRSIFKGTITQRDGKEAEEMLIIKYYDNVMYLKKQISKKKEITLELTRKYDDDLMETYYDIKVIKE